MLHVKQTYHMYGVLKSLLLKPKLLNFRNITTKSNHYTVLGIHQHASTEEIRAAFIKKSKECHPDTNQSNADNHTQFVLVNEAYSTLSKPGSRRDYDLSLNHQKHYKNSRSAKQSTEFEGHAIFHRPQAYNDLNDVKRQANDKFYRNQPYYGIKGLKKLPNSSIVVGCLIFMLVGMVLLFIVVTRSYLQSKKRLDATSARNHEPLMDAQRKYQETLSVKIPLNGLTSNGERAKNKAVLDKFTAD
ncbi:dnaJ-like protein 60 [Physella acuta]|uniref:dnaJ-like protein 60 n=1 Tax=Physella acuta TaxID=109671 RepID=UPI0027DD5286|nr:dnaJ-like protein 60 [Physella acuta]